MKSSNAFLMELGIAEKMEQNDGCYNSISFKVGSTSLFPQVTSFKKCLMFFFSIFFFFIHLFIFEKSDNLNFM